MAHAEAADASGLGTCTYTYDANGNVTTKVLGDSSYTYYSYDPVGRLSSIRSAQPDGSPLVYFEFDRDAAGDIVSAGRESGIWYTTSTMISGG